MTESAWKFRVLSDERGAAPGWAEIREETSAHSKPIPASAKLMGSSGPRDGRSWSTITWPGNVLFVVLMLVVLLFIWLAVPR